MPKQSKSKVGQLQQALASNLKLLVLLRESFRANGAEQSDIFRAIDLQAQLAGSVLPDHMRLKQEEVDSIRRGLVVAPKLEKLEKLAADAGHAEGIQVLKPEQLVRKKQ
jgi:hypothetical protein